VLDRDLGIDGLRGLAIVAMVPAHLAWDSLAGSPPGWLRVFFSLAAPLFLTLSGMMVALTRKHKNHRLTYYVGRGGALVLIGAALDSVVFGQCPFVEMRVLYLIGLAVPLAALFSQLTAAWQTVLCAAVLAAAELLRAYLGYPDVVSFPISTPPLEIAREVPAILRQWVVSGWFPLFPWVFFAFLGVRVFQWQQMGSPAFPRQFGLAAVGLAAVGLVCASLLPTPMDVRGSDGELFYPPTTAFVLVASGVVLLMLTCRGFSWWKSNRPLVRMGQCSLLLYIVHRIAIEWLTAPLLPGLGLAGFLVLYATMVGVLVGLAEAVHVVKRRWRGQLPSFFRFLLGG